MKVCRPLFCMLLPFFIPHTLESSTAEKIPGTATIIHRDKQGWTIHSMYPHHPHPLPCDAAIAKFFATTCCPASIRAWAHQYAKSYKTHYTEMINDTTKTIRRYYPYAKMPKNARSIA